jgi:cell division protein FtsI/penicillin-binding protein 2
LSLSTRAHSVSLLTASVLALSGCGLLGDERAEQARATGAAFLADWQAGRLAEAAARTTDPEAAEQALRTFGESLRVDRPRFEPGDVQCDDGEPCVLSYDATLRLTSLGPWAYRGALTVADGEGDSAPRVAWEPSVLHPQLTADTRLRRVRELPARAAVLDRNGKALAEERPVVTVGVEPRKATDRTYTTLAAALDVDAAGLAKRVRAAEPDAFVEVIALRSADFAKVAARIEGVPGVVTRDEQRTLGPTRSFARAVLGAVAPPTKETLAAAGPYASIADLVGSSGLQAAYQQQLAGRPGGRIELVDVQTGDTTATVAEFTPSPGTPVQTTLDYAVQSAAEQAVGGQPKPTALVAVHAPSGEILAVANGPEGSAGYNRAFVGRYPPGSTFKVVTTLALLEAGLDPDETVPCPRTIRVSGKQFENYDGLGAMGSVPFRRDFAESCNTAFVARSKDLSPGALSQAAAGFGIGADWKLGLDAFPGSVPVAEDPVERAAAAIGQGKVLVSPLGMAMIAAGVRSGSSHPPTLVRDPSSTPAVLGTLSEAGTLRSLMLDTVEDGTASVLKLPGEPVAAKTGTAEYGNDTPPRTHGWIIGFRGDVAFAVLVEDGGSGSQSAGPVARRFLEALRVA